MRIIGIDASSNKTGICLLEDGRYVTHTLIDCHKIKDVYERIPTMVKGICDYIDGLSNIDCIIMEETMLRTNIDTVKKLSYIMGGVMEYAYQRGIKFRHVLPSEWRKKAGIEQSKNVKREILKMEAIKAVEREYGMKLTDDECEALLLARSGFDLPKIEIKVSDVEDDYWGN